MAAPTGTMSAMLLLIPALVATDPPLVTGGSVTRVPPCPSEVALKFDAVSEPIDWVWLPWFSRSRAKWSLRKVPAARPYSLFDPRESLPQRQILVCV